MDAAAFLQKDIVKNHIDLLCRLICNRQCFYITWYPWFGKRDKLRFKQNVALFLLNLINIYKSCLTYQILEFNGILFLFYPNCNTWQTNNTSTEKNKTDNTIYFTIVYYNTTFKVPHVTAVRTELWLVEIPSPY